MNFPSAYPLLADLVLLLHFAVVLFVVGEGIEKKTSDFAAEVAAAAAGRA